MGRLVSENKCFWLFSGGLGQLANGYWLKCIWVIFIVFQLKVPLSTKS